MKQLQCWDRYFVPTTCNSTLAMRFTGDKNTEPEFASANAAEMIQMNWPLRAGHVVLWETADALVLCSSPLAPRANTVLPAPQLLLCGKLRRASSKTKNLPDSYSAGYSLTAPLMLQVFRRSELPTLQLLRPFLRGRLGTAHAARVRRTTTHSHVNLPRSVGRLSTQPHAAASSPHSTAHLNTAAQRSHIPSALDAATSL